MGIKVPPIEKIHEAYSAIADGRITLRDSEADVSSSDLTKKYLVKWKDETYSSNDNASYWKGDLGYPIIAVLMLQGKLSLDREIAEHFKGINWKKLNTEHKNKYSEAVKQIMEGLKMSGVDCDKINHEINKVYGEIEQLTINTKRSSLRPPK
ncbi:MAG: hypothetical protein K2N94_13245 [Lachnospiraceae bacterium]|nr:hypothetical protein [Lachnospiraceae bacterium]